MNELRKQFEALPEITETIKNGIYYGEKSNSYWSAVGASYVSLARINGAWYAFQEQQKKIDELNTLKRDLTGAIDAFLCCEYMATREDCVGFISGLKDVLK